MFVFLAKYAPTCPTWMLEFAINVTKNTRFVYTAIKLSATSATPLIM
jgi:hypothetical protein